MSSPGGSIRFGWLALDLQCDVPAPPVPNDDLVSILVAARIKNNLHLVADFRGISEGMKLTHVDKAAHLDGLVEHVHDLISHLNDLLRFRERRWCALRAGQRHGTYQYGAVERKRRGKRERVSFISSHRV